MSGSQASASQTAADSQAATDIRGKVGAEVGGGLIGMVGGGLAVGVGTMALLGLGGRTDATGIFAVGTLGGLLGGFSLTGLGTSVAGNMTGGRGKIGFSILGSAIGGVGGLVVPVGAGVAINAATRGSDAALVISYLTGGLLGLSGSVIGAVLGYRWSAQPGAEARVRPFVAPNFDGGGRAGFSVRF